MTTVSSAANKAADGIAVELERLTASVHRLLADWEEWRARVAAADTRVRELEAALRDLTSGGVDPVALASRVTSLEQENRFLARRLDRARESVRRISARLQFLDEDR
jgi:hypothetical protein